MMVGLLLSLCTALGWSCADIFRKMIAGRLSVEQLSLWLVLGQASLFACWAGYEVLSGVPEFSRLYWQYALACGTLNALAMWMMLLSFQYAPISLTIPLLSLTPLLSAVFDLVFSNQHFTTLQWSGLVVVTLGATMLGLGKNGWFKEKGAWLMIGVAMVFSLLFALDRVAAGMVGAGIHAFFELAVTGLLISGYVLLRQQTVYFAPPKSGKGIIVAAVCATTIALGLQLYAYQVGTPVAIVEVVKRSVGIFASLFFGYRLFSETISFSKLASASVMTLGIAVLLLGGN